LLGKIAVGDTKKYSLIRARQSTGLESLESDHIADAINLWEYGHLMANAGLVARRKEVKQSSDPRKRRKKPLRKFKGKWS
jgi:hypothetical protein